MKSSAAGDKRGEAILKCNICGAENPDGKSFCNRCGNNLNAENPKMGEEKFVGYDAAALRQAQSEENRRRLIAARQRRHLREKEKKQKTVSVVLNILIGVVMAAILVSTIYICVRRSAIQETYTAGYAGAAVIERSVLV